VNACCIGRGAPESARTSNPKKAEPVTPVPRFRRLARRLARRFSAALAGLAVLTGAAVTPPAADASDATPVSVGELVFNDVNLSAGLNLACASCHTRSTGLADPAGTLLPLGGPLRTLQGHRSSMSLGYLNGNTAMRFEPSGLPIGGFFWDGRAASRAEQAVGPLFNPREMANTTVDGLAAKVRQAPYYTDLVRLFSPTRSLRNQQVIELLQRALAAYQAGESDFALFNSKYDQVLDGTATLTTAEARGLAVFNSPQRGNCASCHPSAVGPDGARPLFTDFRYHALGLPRNVAIQANADANFRDMGLCGPDRNDLVLRVDLCGAFRVPTLRNVARSAPYFHNAFSPTLNDAVAFYATRDVDPARWYPLLNGQPDKFNDLPLGFRGNVVSTAPFGVLPGGRPRLTAQDVSDLVAFLGTLSDDLAAPARSAFVSGAAGAP